MIIKVHPHELELIENEKTNEKESYVSDFIFEFDDEITSDFTKEAFFTKGNTTYKVIIQNDRCDYPQEVIQETGYVDIGVSAFKVVDNKTIRYNPTPITKYIDEGSLKEAENSVPVTPTDKEQMEQMLSNINIEAEKVGTTTTITITNTDGVPKEVEILDGEQGEQGEQGDPGYTPQKGIDYFTPEDIASLNIPRKTSDLNNDSGFITNSTDTLTNYYKKSETYNKTEIDSKISSVYKYKGSVASYEDLPSEDLTIGDVYNVETDGSNYAWNGVTWDKLGGDVDLSNYYNKTQTDNLLSGKVDNTTLNDYYTKTRTDELLGGKVDTSTYNSKMTQIDTSLGNKLEESDLADYVKNTDYATANVGGTIKISSDYNLAVRSNGLLRGLTINYNSYDSSNIDGLISKGTLENVITGKQLVNKTYVDGLVGDIDTALDLINGEVIS